MADPQEGAPSVLHADALLQYFLDLFRRLRQDDVPQSVFLILVILQLPRNLQFLQSMLQLNSRELLPKFTSREGFVERPVFCLEMDEQGGGGCLRDSRL